ESAPSTMKADEPTFDRYVGGAGAGLLLFGLLVVFLNTRSERLIGTTGGWISAVVGVALLLYHSAREREQQLRRAYGVAGYALLALAVAFGAGRGWVDAVPLAVLGLLFLVNFARNEEEPAWRRAVLYTVGGLATAAALAGLVGGM